MRRKTPLVLAMTASLALSPTAVAEDATETSPIPYTSSGVIELGGSAGFTVASNVRDLTLSPMIGYYVADGLELSGILNLSHVKVGDASSTFVSVIAEPSYHLPLQQQVWGFLGVGLGGAYVRGLGGGVAIAPRIGANFLIGRAGVLTPSVSWQYTTHDVDLMGGASATAMAAVSSSLRMNVGYSVIW